MLFREPVMNFFKDLYHDLYRKKTDTWWPIETKTDGAGNATLAGAIRPKNHIQVRTGTEFDIVIGDEIFQLNANDRSGNVSLSRCVMFSSIDYTTGKIYPSTSRGKVLTRSFGSLCLPLSPGRDSPSSFRRARLATPPSSSQS